MQSLLFPGLHTMASHAIMNGVPVPLVYRADQPVDVMDKWFRALPAGATVASAPQ